MKYVFLMNPFGDKKRADSVKQSVFSLRQSLGGENVFFHETEYSGQGSSLSKEYAKKYGSDALVIACGGDGTAHEVANALAYTGTPMCMLPIGTGNDFVRSVLSEDFQKNPQKMVSSLAKAKMQSIDLFSVSCFDAEGVLIPEYKQFCLNIASFGLDTAIQLRAGKMIRFFRRNPLIRKNAYNLSTLYSVLRGWDYEMEYAFYNEKTKEKKEGTVPFILSAICNGAFYGGGFCPAPDAKVDDGLLEVCIAEDISLGKVIALVPKYKKGLHIGQPNIQSFSITNAVIRARNKNSILHGNYDGEDFYGHEVRLDIAPKALRYAFLEP